MTRIGMCANARAGTRTSDVRLRLAAAAGAAAIAAASAAGCGAGLQDLPLGRGAPGESYRVTAVFDHADRVLAGTPVRVGQKTVGRVHGLATDGRHARVDLSLSADVPLPEDVTARIRLPSALGDPFIRIGLPGGSGGAQPDTGRKLRGGDVIPQERTTVGPELETSLASLGLLLNGSGIDQLNTVLTELNNAYGHNGATVRDLIARLNMLLGSISDHRGDLDRTLDAVDETTGRLVAHQQDLENGLDAAAPLLTLLAQQRGRIADLTSESAGIAENADALLQATSGDMGAEIDHLAQILGALRSFNDTDTATLHDTNRFIANFLSSIHGDYLVFDGALDVPQSVEELWSGGRLAGDGTGSSAAVGSVEAGDAADAMGLTGSVDATGAAGQDGAADDEGDQGRTR